MPRDERQLVRLAPRESDRRHFRRQRDAVRPRQQGGLQRVAPSRKSGLELRRRLAVLQEVGGSTESGIDQG